ncbi:MAG TPA: TIGR04255 family protein [Methanoculleus sp.]|nr:TIGR04255 family protein [Methanoculleus sp.]
MGALYTNPPLREAICEFRFPLEHPWDLTVAGLLYERVRGDYPRREQRRVREVEVMLAPEGLREELLITERAQFSTADGGCSIQVGPRLVTVNCLPPYAAWEEFSAWIEDAFTHLQAVIEVEGIRSMALRYVNTIEIPEPDVRPEGFFSFYPVVPFGAGEDAWFETDGFIVGCEGSLEGGRDACRVELSDAIPEMPEASAFLLNIDYFLAKEGTIGPEGALAWIEAAHGRVEAVFESCITDRLREYFRG